MLAGAALAAVSREAERDVVVGVQASRRETERTRGLKKKQSCRNEQENKMKTRIAKIRLKWAFFLFAGFLESLKGLCC